MWNYYLNRAPANLPKLNLKSDNEKKLDILLRPVKTMILTSDTESDESSGISDVFENYHKESFLRPLPGTKRKFLSKIEADRKTVDQFTDDFKSTIKELRENLNIKESLTSQMDHDIEEVLSLKEPRVFIESREKAIVKEPISIGTECSGSDSTSNSGIWNMIRAHRGSNFAVSPPYYDIYDLRPKHYLQRPHVSWKQINESAKKCEKWLDNQCAE